MTDLSSSLEIGNLNLRRAQSSTSAFSRQGEGERKSKRYENAILQGLQMSSSASDL